MSKPATEAPIATSAAWPKLIVSGRSAEQPRPARPKARTPARASPLGRCRDQDERRGRDERQQPVRPRLGELPLDRGEQDAADRDHRPERGQGDGRQGGRRPEIGAHIERRPVAVHRLDDPVQQGERGEDPEPRGQSAAGGGDRRPTVQPTSSGKWQAQDDEDGDEDRHDEREPPPEADPEEDRHEHRSERRPEAEQGIQEEHGPIRGARGEGGRQRVEGRHGQPEADAEARRRQQQHRVRHALPRR